MKTKTIANTIGAAAAGATMKTKAAVTTRAMVWSLGTPDQRMQAWLVLESWARRYGHERLTCCVVGSRAAVTVCAQ